MTKRTNTEQLTKVEMLDGAVRKVEWQIIFTDAEYPDISSIALVVTYLDTKETAAMKSTELTQTQILDWAVTAQGGDEFINELWERGHKQDLERKIADSELVELDLSGIPE